MGARHERRVVQGMRLGKHRPKKDKRTLRLARYLTAIPPHPGTLDLAAPVSSWGMLLNADLGCCSISGAGHMEECWTANSQGAGRVPTDAQVLTAYEAVSGYRPSDPSHPQTNSTDVGANLLDVLNYWRKTGVGGDRIHAFAAVDPKNHAEVKVATYLFGGLYVGLGLPVTAQSQVGKRWTLPRSLKGNGAPYSWGGHCVSGVRYNRAGLTCVTWGLLQPMTWGFWGAFVDECWAVISTDWLSAAGKTPQGLDLAALDADLARVTA